MTKIYYLYGQKYKGMKVEQPNDPLVARMNREFIINFNITNNESFHYLSAYDQELTEDEVLKYDLSYQGTTNYNILETFGIWNIDTDAFEAFAY
jgi:hypothetical protein